MRKLRAGILAWAASWALAAGPAHGAGENSAEFLRFGVGRPSALSDASGAIDRGVTAVYWNPAGLASARQFEVYASHNDLPESLKYDFVGLTLPAGSGTLAYGLQVLSQGAIEKLDNTGASVGSYSALDQAHTLAWGAPFGPLRAGAAVKLVRQSLEEEAGMAYGLDLGAQYDLGPWNLGAGFSNIGTKLKLAGREASLPLTFRAGAGRRVLTDRLFLAMDLTQSHGADTALHIGAAYRPLPTVSVGAGYTLKERDGDGPSGLAAGLGLQFESFRADFAFRPFGEFGTTLQFGAGYRFGGKKVAAEPQRESIRNLAP